ncbi:hypothetical protein COV24_02965 [candidate division WWE3 bacterium CG10_big_fil_rev_8_21_14_0_10_32_10]|uniref:Uncharacterized protein n=1 Tax=candidate division WWE3 bacterium CG10_big_fil_rev_8_21_14_0_10_32_10 TaxID=1975090 RepID=A0A2H0RA70_UNCKA|nr:MAG: hypothetical protein COV24_02965 [candidate division WWE3 bacterium CG10_big_fil_rev_8_21_14_0_10_32_10]
MGKAEPAKYIEPDVLIAIIHSPRFKKKSEEFIKLISEYYKVNFSNLPLEKEEDLIPFETRIGNYLLHKKDNYYHEGLKKLLQEFKLDINNSIHKNVIEKAIFFHKQPSLDYKTKPLITFDYDQQTPKCSIEIYPWTSDKEVDKAFKALKDSFEGKEINIFSKDYRVNIKGVSNNLPSYYIGKSIRKHKIKKAYLKHLKIFFVYMEYKQKLLKNDIEHKKTNHRQDLSNSVIESVYNDDSFEKKLQEIFNTSKMIDEIMSWENFKKVIPNLEKQLEEYNLFL